MQHIALTDIEVAACIMSIAESHTLYELGETCQYAIKILTGTSAFGLYRLDDNRPELLYSGHVPDGFLNEYGAELAKSDPMLERLLETMLPVTGDTLRTTVGWKTSLMVDLLRRWGFSANMCSPIVYDNKLLGVLYTARDIDAGAYSDKYQQYMTYICRATSIALSKILTHDAALKDSNQPHSNLLLRQKLNEVKLPQRALEVALQVCHGRTNKEIARMMAISHYTVKEHVSNLCRKFSVQNRTELASRLHETVVPAKRLSTTVCAWPASSTNDRYNFSEQTKEPALSQKLTHVIACNSIKVYSGDYF